MVKCPTCIEKKGSSKNFQTKGSMRQHHSKVHNEHLPNRECKSCKAKFYDPKGEKKYCKDCNPYKGKNNPNYSNASEKTKCISCGSSFKYYPSEKEGIFCPNCVKNNKIDTTYFSKTGKENPNWKGGTSKEFYRHGWKKCRRKRLEKDNYTCQKCGKKPKELKKNERLEVHHKTPVRKFDKISNAHTIKNTITLCSPCHKETEKQT